MEQKFKVGISKRMFICLVATMLPLFSKRALLKALLFFEKMASGSTKEAMVSLRESFENSNIGEVVLRVAKLANPHARRKMAYVLITRGFIIGEAKREAARQRGETVPFVLLISPTMRCNIRCTGCYAANYSKKEDLPFETVDRLVTEAEELGVGYVTVLGGEPFIWEHIFELFEKHPGMFFQVYTNSILLTKEKIKRLKKLGNVVPVISIEGFKKETDARRGEGVYDKVMTAMDILKKERVPFGFSVTVTKMNEPLITSDEFIDMLIEKGVMMGWMFMCMPVGQAPDLNLMPTPEQRVHLLEFDKKLRKTKPLFIIDFWNDAPFVGGCIAGKQYVHINSEGWVEPCIFTHFAQDNIKDKSLQEVMNSEYFKELRKRQPYNDNLYLPCMWIDNPEVSREMSEKFHLVPTHPGADDVLSKPDLKDGLDEYSKKVKELYEPIWEQDKKEMEGVEKASDKLMKRFEK